MNFKDKPTTEADETTHKEQSSELSGGLAITQEQFSDAYTVGTIDQSKGLEGANHRTQAE